MWLVCHIHPVGKVHFYRSTISARSKVKTNRDTSVGIQWCAEHSSEWVFAAVTAFTNSICLLSSWNLITESVTFSLHINANIHNKCTLFLNILSILNRGHHHPKLSSPQVRSVNRWNLRCWTEQKDIVTDELLENCPSWNRPQITGSYCKCTLTLRLKRQTWILWDTWEQGVWGSTEQVLVCVRQECIHPYKRTTWWSLFSQFERRSMESQLSVSHVPTYTAEQLLVRNKALPGLCSSPLGNPVVSAIFSSGMSSGMLLYEAQIPDAHLFAHSSLLDEPWPTTVCFCSPSLAGSHLFSPVRER